MNTVSERVEVTGWSLSWIPSESVSGMLRRGFDVGLSHYDQPPSDAIADVAEVRRLRDADVFRFANVIGGWAEVMDGRIQDAGFTSDAGLRTAAEVPDDHADRARPADCADPSAARR